MNSKQACREGEGEGAAPRPFKIAILLNSHRSPFIHSIRDSYVRSIRAVCRDASLAFFYPGDKADDFPDPAGFDLIVIGGANVDPRTRHPRYQRIHQFILDVVAHHPRKKLLGVCWGHQTISLLFGGEVVDMEVPELGVTETTLTPAGRRFFGKHKGDPGVLFLQQHHRREVCKAPKGFAELMAGHQSFLSHNGFILTFQGHPEKDAQCAKLRVHDAIRWFGLDPNDRAALASYEKAMERPHDGAEVWRRVLDWARDERYPNLEIHL
ncbi:hypothetical protein VTK26DRAFT_8842 [Humicola hyalothermophila]